MTLVDVDELWGVSCVGYHIQARPDQQSIRRLLGLQQIVLDASPVALNLIPPDALHLSIATLVEAQQPASGEAKWAGIKSEIKSELQGLGEREPYSIVFENLAYSKYAIFVRTTSLPEGLVEIRQRFGALFRSMALAFPNYDQAHVTIARFAERAELTEAAANPFNWLDEPLIIQFEQARLVRESQYPSLQVKEI